jgi:superfamily I DNA and RNA helicase
VVRLLPGEASQIVPLTKGEISELRGADIGNILANEKLFSVSSQQSRQIEDVEKRIELLYEKGGPDDSLSSEDREQLLEDVGTLRNLANQNDQQRGKGSFLSDAARLQERLLADLAREIERAGRS